MGKTVRLLIKSISSSNVRADQAARSNDDAGELKHLLFAVQDISSLLSVRYADRRDAELANSYAESLVSSAERIRVLIERGGV